MKSKVSLPFQNNPPFPPVFASSIQHTSSCDLGLCLRIGVFSSGIPTKILYEFSFLQSVIKFLPIAFLIIFSEEYELWGSSLCNFCNMSHHSTTLIRNARESTIKCMYLCTWLPLLKKRVRFICIAIPLLSTQSSPRFRHLTHGATSFAIPCVTY